MIIRPGGLGDAVLLLPALRALKIAADPVRIDVLAEARNVSVFSLCDAVTATYRYERIRDLFQILTTPYDVVVDTEQWQRLPAVMAFLTRAKIRVGFATNERARLLTHRVSYAQTRYEVKSFLDLIGVVTDIPASSDHDVLSISAPLRDIGDRRSRSTVVLFPGASVPERRWGEQRFGELAARLVQDGCGVAVVGGPSEIEQGRVISSVGGPQVQNLVGTHSLIAVAEVLSQADVMVTADSGLMHLSVAVGTPTVALFGAGIREKWAPRGGTHRVLDARLPCSPCTTFGHTPPCPIGVECLRRISVDEVRAATLDLIRQGRLRGRQEPRCGRASPAPSVVNR